MCSRTSASVCEAIRPRPRAPGGEHGLQRVLVGAQPLVELAYRRQELDHGDRDGALQLSVPGLGELGFDERGGRRAHGGEDFDQVRDAGLIALATYLAAGVGDGALELLL